MRDLLVRLREHPPRVTVIGDALLDRWVAGPVRRLSREAPVPVVATASVRECAGGAGNTAVNLAALGATVRLVSVVGDDVDGAALLRVLTDAGVDVSGVIVRPGGRTPSKTRIVGADQILVRVDAESPQPLGSGLAPRLARHLAGPGDALLVCDYDVGVLDDEAPVWIGDAPRPPLVLVDAHDVARWRPLRPDVVTPNAAEVGKLLGRPLESDRAADATRSAPQILAAAGAALVAVTLDRDGAVVLSRGGVVARTRAHPAPDQRANGAGDTFAAALAVGLAVGAAHPLAADIAQRAADVVVAREGTAVCSLADLAAADAATHAEWDAAAAIDRIRADRAGGRRLVFTNGCFDLLHQGHIRHLRQAKELGDVLIVAVNDDASVRRLKGAGRPVTPLAERAALLAALDCVDHVVAFSEDSPVALLRDLQPEVYTKGGDYTPEMLPETTTVRSYGGQVRILDYLPDHSTSRMVDRIRAAEAGTGG